MAEVSTKLGERLKALRLQRKELDPRWTQDYAARQIRPDLTGTQFARWERGEVLPREETVEKIARVFEVPVESLYAGEPVEVKPEVDSQDQLDRIESMLEEVLVRLPERAAHDELGAVLAAGDEAEATADEADERHARGQRRSAGSAK